MPDFSYKAARSDGKMAQGVITARTPDLASRDLRNQGLIPISIQSVDSNTAVSAVSGGHSRNARANRDDVLSLTSELAVLLRAGLPIDRALKVLIDMSGKAGVRSLLEDLLKTVKGGKGLSHALGNHTDLFGSFYVNMVRSGEASGRLSEVLSSLAAHLERSKAVRSNVVSAMIYPAILLVVAVLSVALMLGFVVPQFEALFSDMGDALPLLTRGVIAAGNFVQAYGWIVLLIMIPLILLLRRWLATPAGIAMLDQKLLRIPVLGQVLFKYETAQFSRTLGTLLHNGVSLLKALSIATGTVGNSQVRAAFEGLTPAVKQGGRMSVALAEAGVFTPMMIQIVRVGEESGRLDEMMLELARVYDDEVESGIKRALTLLEPIMILSLGAIIALIIISILMGILSINELAM
ncbi:type II secretion system F family protein [Nitrincola alkalilacustris]|uniref:type II secretion system F family protein n=1 Tax=Nitrincola alkalilacustris TaxID=1571224 RepID=UPI00124E685C|nr:type II secretion system F family protein [Nitrincola alkalilacustris]